MDQYVEFPGRMSSCPPVLLIGFNRPEFFRRQIENLRRVGPAAVYVNVDGPRSNIPSDSVLRAEVISCLKDIDWPCCVHTRFPESNQGLNAGVIGAITWFFDHVDRGIILEDDCVPRLEFFPFVAELLDRYADDEKVLHISGLSMISEPEAPTSYLFTSIGHIWGWATWRRAWCQIDTSMTKWPSARQQVKQSGPLGRALARKFDSAIAGRKVRWARWWYLANVIDQGLAIVPTVNLIENIGIGPDATNTRSGRHPLVRPNDVPLTFPLRHPRRIEIDPNYEELSARYHARSFKDRTGDRIAAIRRLLRRSGFGFERFRT